MPGKELNRRSGLGSIAGPADCAMGILPSIVSGTQWLYFINNRPSPVRIPTGPLLSPCFVAEASTELTESSFVPACQLLSSPGAATVIKHCPNPLPGFETYVYFKHSNASIPRPKSSRLKLAGPALSGERRAPAPPTSTTTTCLKATSNRSSMRPTM
jgi:hypothetical protein